jgi:hypothetical protein
MESRITDNISTTDRGLLDVILEAHRYGFTVSNDFARRNAAFVGMASSLGLISTRLFGNVYSSEWRPTPRGLALLNERADEINFRDADDEAE